VAQPWSVRLRLTNSSVGSATGNLSLDRGRLRRLFALFTVPPLACACMVGAQATPLDVWLQAARVNATSSTSMELFGDVMNESVDVFDVRESELSSSRPTTGDYRGWHLFVHKPLTPQWSVDASFWGRQASIRSDQARFNSGHIAAQYQWLQQVGWVPYSALRLSYWGSRSSGLQRSMPIAINGTRLESLNVVAPRDRQLQVDLIASWREASVGIHVFSGLGRSHVRIGVIGGTMTIDDCLYRFSIAGGRTNGQLARPCGDLVEAEFNLPASTFGGLGPDLLSGYDANFYQAGTSVDWQRGDWSLKCGYLIRWFRRSQLDDSLSRANLPSVNSVRLIAAELSHKLTPQISAVLRAEITSSQLMLDVPSIYNGLTAPRLGKRYGFVSVGLGYVFQ